MNKDFAILVAFICSFGLIFLEQSKVITVGTPLFSFVSVLAYSLMGASILFGVYRLLDWILPADVEHQIFEKNNIAAAIFKGLILLGIAIIIAAVIISP